MRGALALGLLLASAPAWAQGVNGTLGPVVRSVPSSPSFVAVPTAAGVVIPYTPNWVAIRYVVGGALSSSGGGGCATWGTTAPAFSTNSAAPGCAVGFPIAVGSFENRLAARDGSMPPTPLQAIEASGANLTITYEVQ